MTAVERLQTALTGLGLKAVEARLESLLEEASKNEPSYADFLDAHAAHDIGAGRAQIRSRVQGLVKTKHEVQHQITSSGVIRRGWSIYVASESP